MLAVDLVLLPGSSRAKTLHHAGRGKEFAITRSAIRFEFSSSPGGTRPCRGNWESSLEDILEGGGSFEMQLPVGLLWIVRWKACGVSDGVGKENAEKMGITKGERSAF